jgi:hypothetical protein
MVYKKYIQPLKLLLFTSFLHAKNICFYSLYKIYSIISSIMNMCSPFRRPLHASVGCQYANFSSGQLYCSEECAAPNHEFPAFSLKILWIFVYAAEILTKNRWLAYAWRMRNNMRWGKRNWIKNCNKWKGEQ